MQASLDHLAIREQAAAAVPAHGSPGVELANMAAADDDRSQLGDASPTPSFLGSSPMSQDYMCWLRRKTGSYSATSSAVGTIVEESTMPMIMSRLDEYMEERIQELGRMADALARKVCS
jgi:hypothetical protein